MYSYSFKWMKSPQRLTKREDLMPELMPEVKYSEEKYPDPPPYPNPFKVLNPLFIRFLQSLVTLHEYYHNKKVNFDDVCQPFLK